MQTSSRSPQRRTGGEPSWPRVLATTVGLWLKRQRLRWLPLAAVGVTLAVVAGLAVVALVVTGTPGSRAVGHRAGRAPPRGPAAAAVGQAAAWVAGQVSHGAMVACDPATCAALQRRGFPAGNLVMLRPGAPGPPGSSLIAVTAAVRGEFGRELASWAAPVVLAAFGAGRARVEILAAAPGGPAAYLDRFRADLAARKAAGAELLRGRAVETDPLARRQLSEGLADSRLIATIGMMAALHPVHLVAFGDASPGAAPGVPLRSALLYGVMHGVTAGTALLAPLRALLLAQQPPYRPASVQTVRLAAGQSALRIVFDAPDPAGLLNASQPLVRISPP